jgi:hypothetical protein
MPAMTPVSGLSLCTGPAKLCGDDPPPGFLLRATPANEVFDDSPPPGFFVKVASRGKALGGGGAHEGPPGMVRVSRGGTACGRRSDDLCAMSVT